MDIRELGLRSHVKLQRQVEEEAKGHYPAEEGVVVRFLEVMGPNGSEVLVRWIGCNGLETWELVSDLVSA